MTWKTQTLVKGRLRAHADGRPVRVWSRPIRPTPRAKRQWIFTQTVGLTEKQLNVQAGELEDKGYRYERLITPEVKS